MIVAASQDSKKKVPQYHEKALSTIPEVTFRIVPGSSGEEKSRFF
jgi:hypothetical protein